VFFGGSDQGRDYLRIFFHVLQVRNGLQLHVETIPMWSVCLHLECFSSEQVPRNGSLKSCYFRF
jgi:hypothetical protein